jgi:hypothetical protein
VVIGCFDQFCEAMQGPTVVVMDNGSSAKVTLCL